MKGRRIAAVLVAVLLAGVTYQSSATNAVSAPSHTRELSSDALGTEIVRSMFGVGPLAKFAQELGYRVTVPIASRARYEQAITDLVDDVRDRDKGVFERLGSAVRSGKSQAAADAISEVGLLSLAVMEEEYGISDPGADGLAVYRGQEVFLEDYVAVVNVAVVANELFIPISLGMTSSSRTLDFEVFVDDLTEAFAIDA